ncbi:MAG: hypothetical protein ACSLFE_07180 [Gemmatimonadaceae bacterium]
MQHAALNDTPGHNRPYCLESQARLSTTPSPTLRRIGSGNARIEAQTFSGSILIIRGQNRE